MSKMLKHESILIDDATADYPISIREGNRVPFYEIHIHCFRCDREFAKTHLGLVHLMLVETIAKMVRTKEIADVPLPLLSTPAASAATSINCAQTADRFCDIAAPSRRIQIW